MLKKIGLLSLLILAQLTLSACGDPQDEPAAESNLAGLDCQGKDKSSELCAM